MMNRKMKDVIASMSKAELDEIVADSANWGTLTGRNGRYSSHTEWRDFPLTERVLKDRAPSEPIVTYPEL